MRQRILTVLAALAVIIGMQFAAPSPAHAGYNDCITPNLVCLWEGTGGNGNQWSWYANPGTCVTMESFLRNKMESFYNSLNNGKHVQFYDLPNCTGAELKRNGGGIGGTFGPFPVGTQDSFCGVCNHRNRVDSIWFNNG